MGPGRTNRHPPFFHLLPAIGTLRTLCVCHLFFSFDPKVVCALTNYQFSYKKRKNSIEFVWEHPILVGY